MHSLALLQRKLLLSLFLILVSATISGSSFLPRSHEKDFDSFEDDDYDDSPLDDIGVGYFILAAIILIVVFIGIPCLLCFCCAWCCFSGRKQNKTTVSVVAPSNPYSQQQYLQGYQTTTMYSTPTAPSQQSSQIGFAVPQPAHYNGVNPPPYQSGGYNYNPTIAPPLEQRNVGFKY